MNHYYCNIIYKHPHIIINKYRDEMTTDNDI